MSLHTNTSIEWCFNVYEDSKHLKEWCRWSGNHLTKLLKPQSLLKHESMLLNYETLAVCNVISFCFLIGNSGIQFVDLVILGAVKTVQICSLINLFVLVISTSNQPNYKFSHHWIKWGLSTCMHIAQILMYISTHIRIYYKLAYHYKILCVGVWPNFL